MGSTDVYKRTQEPLTPLNIQHVSEGIFEFTGNWERVQEAKKGESVSQSSLSTIRLQNESFPQEGFPTEP